MGSKQLILNEVSDLVGDFLYGHRMGDEDLPLGVIEKAIVEGETTTSEITKMFGFKLENDLKIKLTKNQRRVNIVLHRMIEMNKESEDYTDGFSDILEDGLGSLLQDDFFGSEGSTDPRGDARDLEDGWSMLYVQGVDTLI